MGPPLIFFAVKFPFEKGNYIRRLRLGALLEGRLSLSSSEPSVVVVSDDTALGFVEGAGRLVDGVPDVLRVSVDTIGLSTTTLAVLAPRARQCSQITNIWAALKMLE